MTSLQHETVINIFLVVRSENFLYRPTFMEHQKSTFLALSSLEYRSKLLKPCLCQSVMLMPCIPFLNFVTGSWLWIFNIDYLQDLTLSLISKCYFYSIILICYSRFSVNLVSNLFLFIVWLELNVLRKSFCV